MLDVGPTNQNGEYDADLAVFVDRLAAAGRTGATESAQAQIRRLITGGAPPPGLRRLAEALAASVAERPPSPRRPAEDPGSIVTAMRADALVVLEDFDAAAVARAVAALLADGRRIVVTAAAGAELAAVRDALPPHSAARALDALPPLAPAELRELRRLLATSTPEPARPGRPASSTRPHAAPGGGGRRSARRPSGRPGRVPACTWSPRSSPTSTRAAQRRHLGGPFRQPVAGCAAPPCRVRVGAEAAGEPHLRPAPRGVRPHAGGHRAGRRGHRPCTARPARLVHGDASARRNGCTAPLPRVPRVGWPRALLLPFLGASRGAPRAGSGSGGPACAGDR